MTFSSSPQSGLCPRTCEVGRLQLAPVVGPLVVLEDLLAVQVVHQAWLRRSRARRRAPSISASTSAAVVVDGERRAGRGADAEAAASAAGRSGGRRGRRRRRGRGSRRRRAGGRRRARRRRARRGRAASRGPWIVRPATSRRGARARTRSSSSSCARTASMPMPCEQVDRGAQADGLGDRRRAGLELARAPRPTSTPRAGRRDHVAAAEERRHRVEQLAAAVQHADAGRAVGLVAGPGVEVGVDARRTSTGICGTACAPSTERRPRRRRGRGRRSRRPG